MPYISNIPIGSVAYASVGTNTADVAGQCRARPGGLSEVRP